MYSVCVAFLMCLLKILIQNALHRLVFRIWRMTYYSWFFVDNKQVLVFINNLNPLTVKAIELVVLPNSYLHAWNELEIVLSHGLSVDSHRIARKDVFRFGATYAVHLLHDEGQELVSFQHLENQFLRFAIVFILH